MSDRASAPFERFTFTLVEDKRPRASFRMKLLEGGMYELHVERGTAANPNVQFTREVPLESAQKLKDALQAIGVFGWSESYGTAAGQPSRRWSVSTVFKEGVFSVASKGGSEVPQGFDDMLEELYQLDFPRPSKTRHEASAQSGGMGALLGASGMRGIGPLSAGDLGAYSAISEGRGVDFSRMSDLLSGSGLPGLDAEELNDILAEVGRNPEALQQRMRDEFKHMTPDEQNRMLDALAATGMASRAWWERFLRG